MMAQQRVDWTDASPVVHAAVETRTGPIRSVQTVTGGKNSAIAAVLDTASGRVFVKGLHSSHGGAVAQGREAAIAKYVTSVSPRMLWRLADIDGWDLLGIDYIDNARHADLRPGSADLPAVVNLLRRSGQLVCPDLPEIKTPAQRWREFVDHESELELFTGTALLHTDCHPENILLSSGGRAHLIDWAWPTVGAAFIDPCVLGYRLVASGHTPASAESQVSSTPAWRNATPASIAAFTRANTRAWHKIARDDPQPWKRNIAAAAHRWAVHCAHRAL